MDREKYNSCIAAGLKGKKLSKPERQLEFCVVSKMCSGKVKTREEAVQVCSLPKEPKPSRVSTDHRKYDRCVNDVKRKIEAGEMPLKTNPYAVCGASVGKPTGTGIFVKAGRKKIELSQADLSRICPCASGE